jgi:hypothetical protein
MQKNEWHFADPTEQYRLGLNGKTVTQIESNHG